MRTDRCWVAERFFGLSQGIPHGAFRFFDDRSHLFATIFHFSSLGGVKPKHFLMKAIQPTHTSHLNRGKPIPQWSPKLSVGNAKLDEQHITLIELGRDLMRLLDTDTATETQVHVALEDIVKLSRRHNALEEKILQANGCPTLAEHIAVHLTAQTQLATLLSDVSRSTVNRLVLSGMIADWMDHHISENDLPVKNYMKHVPKARAAG